MATLTHTLVEHFFRHQYGRLVAKLARTFGVQRLDLVEDVVQSALLRALQSWSLRGVPDDPAAWLYRVARNAAIDALRHDQHWDDLKRNLCATEEVSISDDSLDDTFHDEQLRLLFACCHPALSFESQIALALKTLCGFSTKEIASGLLIGEEAVEKRLSRAKERLREVEFDPSSVRSDQLADRLAAVRTVVYMLFNEGYYSAHAETLIRRDLCDEAIRLGRLLTTREETSDPTTAALMALMLLNYARFDARISGSGQLLLQDQDRTRWDAACLAEGFHWFRLSGSGDVLSRYHLEAGIVSKHIAATSLETTDWAAIVQLYDLLIRMAPSPIQLLNRAVAVAYLRGPRVGLDAIAAIPREEIPQTYSLWPAVIGELHRQAGEWQEAAMHFKRAYSLATAPTERELIRQRLQTCEERLGRVPEPVAA